MHVRSNSGFTLVEALITLVLLTVLCGLTFVGFSRPQATISLNSEVDTLLADIKSQQQLAMMGDGAGGATQQSQGIFFEAEHYTLFAGPNFDSGAGNNFTVTPNGAVTLSTTMPNSLLQFDKASGEVHDYDAAHNTITVHAADNTKTVTVNRFGAVTTD